MSRISPLVLLLFCLQILPATLLAQSLSSDFYEIGSPTLTEYYVDPTNGRDSNSGKSLSAPKRTVTSIWNSLPQNVALTSGIRINLLAGVYTSDHLPNYWENRIGTFTAPIILSAIDGYGSVFFSRDINMSGVSYFYLLNVDIQNSVVAGHGDAFHAEKSNYILLRGNSFNGAPNGRDSGADVAHETIKFNQSRNIFIENNNIQGAGDNGIDFVAVYGGHILANRIHDTQSWCAYVKGGSSYILIEGNIVYDCGEGGISAGQGTGFEFMDAPYLRYEANYIKIVNNVLYNVTGAALGINGGYNILVAHNTAYKVGSRSHLVEVVFGERSCDGDSSACEARRASGGWGPSGVGSDFSQPIGNRNVSILNNVIYNPAGFVSGSQHFAIHGPRSPTVSGIPSPQTSDSGLEIRGNVIWNGGLSMALGIEENNQGCQPGHPTCSLTQLLADNYINLFEPDFISASRFDFRPASSGALSAVVANGIHNFTPLEAVAGEIPEGDVINQLTREFSGAAVSARPPGAIVSASSSIDFSTPEGGVARPPSGGGDGVVPTLSLKKISAKKNKGKVAVFISAIATDSEGIASVKATVLDGKKSLGTLPLKLSSGLYSVKKSYKTKAKKLTIKVIALDAAGQLSAKSKKVKVN